MLRVRASLLATTRLLLHLPASRPTSSAVFSSFFVTCSASACARDRASFSSQSLSSPLKNSTNFKSFDTTTPQMASSAAKIPTRSEILSLFRSLLRTARTFRDYNIREYAKRRTIDGFRLNKALSEEKAVEAFTDGKSQLEVMKGQAIIYSLYEPKVKSIMELQTSA